MFCFSLSVIEDGNMRPCCKSLVPQPRHCLFITDPASTRAPHPPASCLHSSRSHHNNPALPRIKTANKQVVCEYPDRDRTKGNSSAGPVSWMTEYPPEKDINTTYKTRAEMEQDELSVGQSSPTTHTATNPAISGGRTSASATPAALRSSRSAAKLRTLLPTTPTPSWRSPRTTRFGDTAAGKNSGAIASKENQRPPSHFGPTKEVGSIGVDFLFVRYLVFV